MTNDPLRPSVPAVTTNNTTIANTRGAVGVKKSLHDRLRNPVMPGGVSGVDPMTCPNRLALLLDVSGSMGGEKIVSLRDACSSFVTSCNFGDTSLAIEPFGEDDNPPRNRLALTCFSPFLMTTIQSLRAAGGTPMAQHMKYVLDSYSLTRAVLVSDGQPDNESAVFDQAACYAEAGLPCDCVHIGNSTSGEDVLRRVAEITGGQFIKFTDIASFSRSFKYLTPAYYAQLTSGTATAAMLGATEIK
jgi:uncharacterized protein YegL